MQQLNYPTFYTKFGVRTLQHLVTPRTFPSNLMQLPADSVVHYLDYNGITMGPAATDLLYKPFRTQIPVHNVLKLKVTVGKPQFVASSISQDLARYYQQNRHMRNLRDQSFPINDRRTPIVVNYAPVTKSYRYPDTPTKAYQKHRNLLATAFAHSGELSEGMDRNHFFFFDAPRLLPGVQQLEEAIRNPTVSSLKYFAEPEAILILEVWKWLAKERKYAIDSDESDSLLKFIPTEKLHLFNFVFQESGQWLVINLGVLNSFRRPFKTEAKAQTVITSVLQREPVELAKRALRFFMGVTALRSLAVVNTTKDLEEPAVKAAEMVDDDDEFSAPDVSQQTPEDLGEIDDLTTTEVVQAISDGSDIESLDPAAQEALLAAQDAQIEEDLGTIEASIAKATERVTATRKSYKQVVYGSAESQPHDAIDAACEKLLEDGVITFGEARRLGQHAQRYKTITMPNGQTLEEFVKIPPEVLAITEEDKALVSTSVGLPDQRMLKSSLTSFDSKYLREVLAKDTASMVLAVQNFGVAVTGFSVERHENILGAHDAYVVRLSPVRGEPSTIRFRLPVVREDGVFISNGVPYRLRKQRADLPIRKVSHDRVALISYYGKAFVTRGRLASNDYGRWIEKKVTAMILGRDPVLQEVVASNVCDYQYSAPRQYTVLSKMLKSVVVAGSYYCFDHEEMAKNEFCKLNLDYSDKKAVLFGYNRDALEFHFMRFDGSVYSVSKLSGNTPVERGSVETIFGLDIATAPLEYTTLKVFGREVPIGIVLGMEMGLQNLVDLLDVQPRYVLPGNKLELAKDEVAIAFNDKTMVISRKHRLGCLILGGFNEYAKYLKQFSIYSFDNRGVYQNLLETADMPAKYLREIDLMFAMFVDPISRELLVQMKEPTTFKGLLFRSTELLLNDTHPELMDPRYMRIRGYERFSGAVYAEMVSSLRNHNNRQGKRDAQIEQPPFAVATRISEDPAKMQVHEINPIKSIKEAESATYAGEGGRMKRAMTRVTRSYHPHDMGVISESTVDNSDVGITINMSANPKLTSLRGLQGAFDFEDDGATSLLSTSAMVSPFSNFDDPKRVNFIAIQQEHALACDGYHQFTVRTGYDNVIAERTSELFAVIAKKPGTVRSVKENGIIVDYEDGTDQGYQLGRRFGNAAGLTIAHNVVTTLRDGDKFQPGEAICYNDGFFEQDFFDPKRIALKNAVDTTTVLWESADTHEDSSAISRKLSGKLSANISKVKTVQVAFDQKVSQLVTVGQKVEADSVLCFIEDAVTASSDLFTRDNIDTLRAIGAQTPRAKVKGVVERIEYFYHGDKEDMGESILALANQGDKELKARALARGGKVFTGEVDGGFRIDANQLPMGYMAIRIYITSQVASGVGDKGVFCNQLKTVHGRVIEDQVTTESGEEVDAIFGMKSIENRIVHSPVMIGTTARLMYELGKKAVAAYRGQK